jgi:D-arginine dehydrogenase
MNSSFDVDILILGAGMAGASLAWRLMNIKTGLRPRVILAEREAQPGYHSTGRSAALYMASYGPPAARALTRASAPFYLSPPPGFTDSALLSPRGALYLAGPGQEAALDQLQAELAPLCPQLQRLDANEVLQRVPSLRPDQVRCALLDPQAMDIDVHALHQGYLRGFRQTDGQLRCNAGLVAAHRVATASGDCWQVTLADASQVTARVVVNATGAWADEVATALGARPVGLQPKRRSAFTFRPPEGLATQDWPAVIGVAEDWYFKSDAGQLLGSPANADDVPPHDVQPETLDIALGIDRIQSVSHLQINRPTATWAGLRSFVADGELVIGFDDACPGLFWLAGQGGYGIQSAAGASALAAALLLDLPLPEVLVQEGVDPASMAVQRLRSTAPRPV